MRLAGSSGGELSRRIRRLRAAKPARDPWRPQSWLLETERLPFGAQAQVLTVFLTGAECPFTCIFCDLWLFTLDGATPASALPAQLRQVLSEAGGRLQPDAHLKLYNASNFFDARAVPVVDERELLELLAPFAQVVVESHPRLVTDRCMRFADRLEGRLQVAMGLETVHPEATERLNKGATPQDFARASERLLANGIGVRAFVLVAAPFVPAEEDARWVMRSVRFAVECGAEHVALIPVRPGNGALEALQEEGHFHPASLEHLELCFEGALAEPGAVVTVDTWDLERFSACPRCLAARRERLERMNRTGHAEPRVTCAACGDRSGG